MATVKRSEITRLFETGRTEVRETKASVTLTGRTGQGQQAPVGRRFGDLILAEGLVTQEQFDRALA
ncbi:MAG: hypothetical protein HYS77_10250, partial [Candidatus Rokubacteria bacterium]|nr:hypothetical protein [Candidatus Rokubacteria bacterium]